MSGLSASLFCEASAVNKTPPPWKDIFMLSLFSLSSVAVFWSGLALVSALS